MQDSGCDCAPGRSVRRLSHTKLRRLFVATVALSILVTAEIHAPSIGIASDLPESEDVFAGRDPKDLLDEDYRFAMVSDRVPGFGGAYYDLDNVLQVWLTRPTDDAAQQARSWLIEIIGEQFAATKIQVRAGSYSYADLKRWKDELADIHLVASGLVYKSISEDRNKVTLAFNDSDRVRPAVMLELDRLGIPRPAVRLVDSAPVRLASSLRDEHRPIVGGIQIEYSSDELNIGTGQCTLGFVSSNSGDAGFVTNSHCSAIWGEVDGGFYWQPVRPFGDLGLAEGREIKDPPFFTGGSCPTGRRCRWSDANFVIFSSGVSKTQGYIARPGVNSVTWDGTSKYRVTTKATPLLGKAIQKVGRTTGRTLMQVDETCVDLEIENTNITMRCQYIGRASAGTVAAGPGDSGAPVYRTTNSPALNDVQLGGILWGVFDEPLGNYAAYTSVFHIDQDLGTVRVCATGFGC